MSRARPLKSPAFRGLALCACVLATVGCKTQDDVALSKQDLGAIPKVPVPSENGPKLASIADSTPVFERPTTEAPRLGYLHAGGRVARAEQPFSKAGCTDGWYPVRPRGFVCASGSATTDLRHPTLAAMAIQPLFDQPLPFTYARVSAETPLYERDSGQDGAVREIGKLKKRAGMAVVGSWTAKLPEGGSERLALLTSGKFVKARDLEAAKPSAFAGVELDGKHDLPLAFVVKRGVKLWKLEGDEARQDRDLEFHEQLDLTGKFRTAHGEKFWAAGERWVRHKDVTVVLPRSNFPEFAKDGQKWLDVSLVVGTLIAYEGKKPVFTTLISVARDAALGDAVPAMPSEDGTTTSVASPALALGTFEVKAKHVTLVGADAFVAREAYQLFDLPWTIELASGRLIHAAYWHDRFGIEHGPGSIQLSPADAVRLFQWITPSLPDGWHGTSHPGNEAKTLVVVRK
jgi:hypothetical protein